MSFLNSLFEGLQTFGSEMTDWGPAVGELTDMGRQALGEGVELAQRGMSTVQGWFGDAVTEARQATRETTEQIRGAGGARAYFETQTDTDMGLGSTLGEMDDALAERFANSQLELQNLHPTPVWEPQDPLMGVLQEDPALDGVANTLDLNNEADLLRAKDLLEKAAKETTWEDVDTWAEGEFGVGESVEMTEFKPTPGAPPSAPGHGRRSRWAYVNHCKPDVGLMWA